MLLSGKDCIDLISAMRNTIEANRDKLSALDAATGDGDHGVNLATAADLALVEVQALDEPKPADVMKTVGTTLINDMGGASGAIFGSFFRGGSRAIKEMTEIGLPEFVNFVEFGLIQVQKRGKAQPGDKTFVDALSPAVVALQDAVQNDYSFPEAMAFAAKEACEGAEETANMVAKFGRAKFMGERSIGHQDAGATSMALILTAWANFLNK
ncbi:MAG: dihydroxyacetone kinase-like protein [Candidatus Promineifilaceae bacterium]|jgi:dihydroxyacetone kinase-like protein